MENKGNVKVLPYNSSMFDCHRIFYWYNVDHQHTTLSSTAMAGLSEAFFRLPFAYVFITKAFRALKVLTLIFCYWLKAQLRPAGGSKGREWMKERKLGELRQQSLNNTDRKKWQFFLPSPVGVQWHTELLIR